ncbi:acyltransferase family protein [Massilia sp. DWR3-1-1]|uniref:acyltransferase family protein n=1 Tax=Massilia sp. DWR3-1-1 TaxID=2804559 RepID=UPI003CF1E8D1
MRHPFSLTITWNAHSADRANNWQSIVIAFVRALAAIEVAASHIRALFYPGMRTIADPSLWFQGFAFFTGFGHQAVLLFFIISGWLVGGSLLDKWQQRDVIAHYAIDRVTRLWTVLIPVFILTLLLGIASGQLDATAIDYGSTKDFSMLTLIGNLVGLQMMAVPTFGNNFALWSLSNETWYYLMFPLLIVMVRTTRLAVRTMCALFLTLLTLTLPPVMLLYFVVWLMGTACSRIQINCSRFARVGFVVAAMIMSVYFRLTGITDDLSAASFLSDVVLCSLFLLVLCSLQNSAVPSSPVTLRFAAIGRYFAEFSFTLYVIHVPLIQMMKHGILKLTGVGQLSPSNPVHLAWCAGMLCLVIASAWLFYLMFESRTPTIRKWAKRKLLRAAPQGAVTA